MSETHATGLPFALLVDVTRCTGCAHCVIACAEHHGDDPRHAVLTSDRLSADSRCALERIAPDRFLRRSCMHCLEPSCVAACLVGGLTKRPDGPVVYDADRCIGCRYCMLACPFHVPRYEWDTAFPFMRKCTMCIDRLEHSQRPACVEACPHEALEFGRREHLLQRANERIAARPELYLPKVWGESEWGGTSVLYISDVDLTGHDVGAAVEDSIPGMTGPVLHATPYVAGSVLAATSGLRWIIQRRQKLMGSAGEDAGSGDDR